jgi:eukaryotic-like serine/threonine-protein kinase
MNIGERIGDYEIVEILGAGGMGQVYKVRNVLSDRIEAMKVLLPNLEGDADLADRFLREIKVQAALDHPNIAKLNTAMRAGNQLVMVMEFVDGTSLAQILERGPIAARTVASYVAQVLDALAYAHARGVVHRDIKPANIMVAPGGPGGADGTVKLMDFGIARMKADRQLTQTGSTVGSLFYMSPEQIQGGTPDPRSDLYSVGITMYEMVTGRRPFVGDSDFSIMSAHMQQRPTAPIEVIPGVPAALNDLILMAIEKDPAARFQSAGAFRAALGSAFPQAVAATIPTKTMPTPIMGTPIVPMPTVATPIMAAPIMHAAPPPMPQAPVMSAMAPQAPQPKSRRGLYMALGSLATLAVLIAAVIEGPKLMHGGAANAQGGAASGAAAAAAPATPTPVTPAPESAQVTTPAPTPVATQVTTPQAVAAAPQQPEQPFRRVTPSAVPAAAPGQTPVQAADSPAAAPPPPAAANTPSPELKELRDRINRASVRAAAAQAGVRSIEQGVQRQGFGLRGDIKAASIRLDVLLQEARTALQMGDADGARQNLQYAEGTLATIEKFLGY